MVPALTTARRVLRCSDQLAVEDAEAIIQISGTTEKYLSKTGIYTMYCGYF